jgi:hypothetical protein
LNRLASVEFHFAENLRTRSKASTDDVHPWAWHKVWLNSFLHPNDGTWNRLLSEKSISFIRVCFWITLTSLSFPLVYSIVVWVKFPQSITTGNLLGSAKNILLIGIFEPIGFIAITGTIHVLAKLFGKGDYRNLFVVFATSYVPISLLHTFIALFKWSFASKAWLYASVLLNFYFIIFVSTEIIKFNYHTNRLVALLISIAVTATSYFVVYRIYCLTGLGI